MLDKKIISIIKKLNGSLIGFCIDNKKIVDTIDSNNNITRCDLLNCWSEESNKFGFGKKISVNSLRKKYKKKKNNYIIAYIDDIEKYNKTFIRDSIYINNKYVYLYTYNLKYNYELLIKKYKRYDVDIEIYKETNGIIIKVDTSKANNNKIKDIGYYITDTVNNGVNVITDILIN